MKTTALSRFGLALALFTVSAAAVVPAPSARAAGMLSFHVDLNTASLVGNAAAPFAFDFQLSQGNGLSNSVSLGNFTFQGGSATGAATASGGASGGVASTVRLQDTSAINEFYQTFSAGVTRIGFDVSVTLNASAGTPDLFTVSILDKQLFPIFTNSPGVGTSAETDYLVGLTINDQTTFSSVRTYTSNVSGTTTPGVTAAATLIAVPEPSSEALASLLALAGWAGWTLRRSSARQRELRTLQA